MAVLRQILENNGTGAPFALSEAVIVVGRDSDCQLKLDSPAVSRHHARIIQEGSRFFLEDSQSRNGTLVNGKRIEHRELLRDGDQIEFSTTRFLFSLEQSLEDPSGTWRHRPVQINCSDPSSESAGSIYRQAVRAGDKVFFEGGEAGAINEKRILATIPATADALVPLITVEAPRKLTHSLQLLQSLRRMIQVSDVLAASLEKLLEMFPAIEGFAVVETGGNPGGLRVLAAMDRRPGAAINLCLPLLQRVIDHPEALLYLDHRRTNDEPQPGLSDLAPRSILAAPLLSVTGTAFGAVQLDTSLTSRSPDRGDLERLVILSQVMAFVLEMAAETKIATERAACVRATATAYEISARFRQVQAPEIPGFLVQHKVLAAPAVGGDVVDYISLSDGRTAVVLIDVPGCGVDAVVLMTILSRVIAEAITATGSAACALQQSADQLQRRMTEIPLGISVALMIIDPERSTALLSVAGDCEIFRAAHGMVDGVRDDMITGPPLGMSSGGYRESEVQIAAGETLLICTSGFSRLHSGQGQTAEQQQRLRMLRAATGQPEPFSTRLHQQIEDFRSGAPLPDDVAFAMIHRHCVTAHDLVVCEPGSRRT